MVSSKGKETNPELKKKVTQEVKQQPNKDGSGKGQMAAWKSSKIAKEYEKRGGDYEAQAGSKNQPKKGAPEAKSEPEKENDDASTDATEGEEVEEKPKANKKKTTTEKKGASKAKKEPAKGTRSSSRLKEGTSKSMRGRSDHEEEEEKATKKAKST